MNIIRVRTSHGYEFLRLNNICYLQAHGNYCFIHTNDGQRWLAAKLLKHFENRLVDCCQFVRVHSGYIVNMQYCSKVDLKTSTLYIDDVHIPIARRRKNLMKQFIEEKAL